MNNWMDRWAQLQLQNASTQTIAASKIVGEMSARITYLESVLDRVRDSDLAGAEGETIRRIVNEALRSAVHTP